MQRYATKEFDKKKIEQKKIDELFDLIRLSPSSLNIQPWKIKVVTEDNVKEKLLPVSWNQKQITTCSHLLVFCADTNLISKVDAIEKMMIKSGATKEDIKPYLDMINNTINNMSPEQQVSWVQRQLYLAVSNAVNGAKALGFDSCPMEGFDPKEYSNILKLPDNLVPTAVVTVGYAADTPRPKVRLSKEEIFF
ncbi:MAG: NAD(P)H-dependent oxidoreductase [Candidatus Woesearchaeota archaeon]